MITNMQECDSYLNIDELKMTFSQRLTDALKASDMTQKDLAEKVNIDYVTLSNYKNLNRIKTNKSSTDKEALSKFPSLYNACKIANVLNVSLNWLCGFSDDDPSISTDYNDVEAEEANEISFIVDVLEERNEAFFIKQILCASPAPSYEFFCPDYPLPHYDTYENSIIVKEDNLFFEFVKEYERKLDVLGYFISEEIFIDGNNANKVDIVAEKTKRQLIEKYVKRLIEEQQNKTQNAPSLSKNKQYEYNFDVDKLGEIFSNRLTEARKNIGMTKESFSSKVGIEPSTLSKYEKLDKRITVIVDEKNNNDQKIARVFPTIDDVCKMAKILNISLNYLCGFTLSQPLTFPDIKGQIKRAILFLANALEQKNGFFRLTQNAYEAWFEDDHELNKDFNDHIKGIVFAQKNDIYSEFIKEYNRIIFVTNKIKTDELCKDEGLARDVDYIADELKKQNIKRCTEQLIR